MEQVRLAERDGGREMDGGWVVYLVDEAERLGLHVRVCNGVLCNGLQQVRPRLDAVVL